MRRLIILLLFLLPMLCVAQKSLTLADCVALAKLNNRRVAAAHYDARAAHYARRAAYANFLPRLSLVGTGGYSTADGALAIEGGRLPIIGADGLPTGATAYFPGATLDYRVGWAFAAGLKMEQPLFAGGKILAGCKLSKVAQSIARENIRLTESEVIVETAHAYANLVRAVEKQKVADAYNNLLRELMRSVEKAVERGVKSHNDYLRVEAKMAESELNVLRTRNARRLAAMNLAHYIGLPLDSVAAISAQLPAVDYAFEPSADVSARPEARILAATCEAMRLKASMARAEILPQMGLTAGWGNTHAVRVADDNLFGGWDFFVGVRVAVPIFNWGAHSKYREAQMLYSRARCDRQDKMQQLRLQAEKAANNLHEAAFEVRLAQKSAASAAENMRVSGSRFRAGIETLADYLEAQTQWLGAEEALVEARINRFVQFLEYHKAVGSRHEILLSF